LRVDPLGLEKEYVPMSASTFVAGGNRFGGVGLYWNFAQVQGTTFLVGAHVNALGNVTYYQYFTPTGLSIKDKAGLVNQPLNEFIDEHCKTQ
jgi:hypothetical protein